MVTGVSPTETSPDSHANRRPAAVVMNLFYTGLGIARSLGERGVRVVGLTAQRGVYGNFSRYVDKVLCADSRTDPETLIKQLLELGDKLGPDSVLFPTRDHDLVFLDRFRNELAPYFRCVIPERQSLERCLNKWDTYRIALQAGVPTPKTWLIQRRDDLAAIAEEVAYPCVLKPVAAHQWRAGDTWERVGARKAISIATRSELLSEYENIARVDGRMLIQEIVPGGDDCLIIAACYVDRERILQGEFNLQKRVQTPPGFGTGCVVQSVERPELSERTARLLHAADFTGIAEVEYKWDAASRDYKLIEINPRPWDQHRLGEASGVDLMLLAYCDHAGLPRPAVQRRFVTKKWIAEDAFLMAALRMLWRREPGLGELFRQTRGKKVFAIWSARDPLPFVMYLVRLVPTLALMGVQAIGKMWPLRSGSRQSREVRATP